MHIEKMEKLVQNYIMRRCNNNWKGKYFGELYADQEQGRSLDVAEDQNVDETIIDEECNKIIKKQKTVGFD